MKGKVLDDNEPTPKKSKARPTRGKSQVAVASPLQANSQHVSTKNPFRFPSIQNEEVFESKLQESQSTVNTKKYKSPEAPEESFYTSYSTIQFTGDDDDGKLKGKAPKRSIFHQPASFYKVEQNVDGQHFKFDSETEAQNGGFSPSQSFTKPPKLFKSPEDEFKDSEFFDFSIRPRPAQSPFTAPPSNKYGKLKSDLGVKQIAIKPYKNKYDPQLVSGFEPSFRLRDFPNVHGGDVGKGIASSGQIKTFYDKQEGIRSDRLKQEFLSSPSPTPSAQYAQFIRTKDDERLEQLVEEQFKIQQQKQFAQEKEAELKLQHQQLQRQKEKIKAVEKELNNKVTRQITRQKRRPNPSRRQRKPSYGSNGQASIPVRAVAAVKDGTYRLSFKV